MLKYDYYSKQIHLIMIEKRKWKTDGFFFRNKNNHFVCLFVVKSIIKLPCKRPYL